MSKYIGLFLIVLTSIVYCESCVTYGFENDFEDLFSNNSSLCSNFQLWNIRSYSGVNVESPHERSNKFIQPNTAFSCVTSFPFPMEVDGLIEVTVYSELKSPSDFLSIIVNAINPSGTDTVAATLTLNSAQPTYSDGWHVLRATATGLTSFDGYINLLGSQSEGSKVFVDSFRYISPSSDKNSCNTYIDVESTTLPSVPSLDDEEKCLTYDFETGFKKLFDPENRLCDGFVSWNLGNYSSIGMRGINERSNLFLTPNNEQSCTASFPFKMTPGGIVEVNVYLEPTTSLDHIVVLAKKFVPHGVDTLAGMNMYEPSRATFVKGWNVIRVPIVDLTSFNGYLLFFGGTSEGATVLVDSFRYIPPAVSKDHTSCDIY